LGTTVRTTDARRFKMIYILFKCDLPRDKRKEFHEVYEHQMKLLEENGGKVIGVWDVEMGPCSDFLMIWATEDLSTYEKVLYKLQHDPKGEEIREKFHPMFGNCERWLLRSTSYSPLK